jgi:hypothetical protein
MQFEKLIETFFTNDNKVKEYMKEIQTVEIHENGDLSPFDTKYQAANYTEHA